MPSGRTVSERVVTGGAVHGTRRAFWASAPAPDPVRVGHRWTTPETWSDWDLGLRSAVLDGDFEVGAAGTTSPSTARLGRCSRPCSAAASVA